MGMYHAGEGTATALGFLRFAHAKEYEVAAVAWLSAKGGSSKGGEGAATIDFEANPVGPLSPANEGAVLADLAAHAREALAAYPRTLEEDEAELAAGTIPAGTNRHHAVLLVAGEKAIWRHYVALADAVLPILAAPSAGALEAAQLALLAANTTASPVHAAALSNAAIGAYLTEVVAPLVRRNVYVAPAAAAPAPAAAAAAPTPAAAAAVEVPASTVAPAAVETAAAAAAAPAANAAPAAGAA
jgi:hypothetical protein